MNPTRLYTHDLNLFGTYQSKSQSWRSRQSRGKTTRHNADLLGCSRQGSLVYPRDVRRTSCCKYSGKMKFNQAKPAMESTGPGPLKLQMADESNCTSPCKESDRDKSSIFRIEVNRIINKFHLSPDSHISHPWIPVKHVSKAHLKLQPSTNPDLQQLTQ